MPRIRKKTSKRGTLHQRAKISHKATETRKKNRKEAKKNTQWKSKNPKDPGIPNNFPFKDQILAEVAEQRRQAEEEKERRKEAKKAARVAAKSGAPMDSNEPDDEGSDIQVGVSTLYGVSASAATKRKSKAELDVMDVDLEVPMLLDPALPTLRAVMDQADVVLEVLDARDPCSYRSASVETAAKGKDGQRTLLVLNKIDTCPRESAYAWATYLRRDQPTVFFRSASHFLPDPLSGAAPGKGKLPMDDAVGAKAVIACLTKWAAEKGGQDPLTVAVVGVTNVGKSSLINSLARNASLSVYKFPSLNSPSHSPTTTEHPAEVKIDVGGRTIRFIDTPGLAFEPGSLADGGAVDAESRRVRDILVRIKGRIDRLKDPLPPVADIVSRANTEDLMLFYNLPAFARGDLDGFLVALARASGFIKKGGVLDLTAAARTVLRDWSTGKFPRYTTPPRLSTSESPASSEELADVYAMDDAALSGVPTKKDLRRGSGSILLMSGEVDSRPVRFDNPWVQAQTQSADDDNDEEANIIDTEGEGETEHESESQEPSEEEGDEEEEEVGEETAPSKRKRSLPNTSAPSRKRVAFAPKTVGKTKVDKDQTTFKSALKKNGPVKIAATTKSKPSRPLKVGNIGPKRAAQALTDGEQPYDFGKFF